LNIITCQGCNQILGYGVRTEPLEDCNVECKLRNSLLPFKGGVFAWMREYHNQCGMKIDLYGPQAGDQIVKP
jgi:hypothetical protein